MFFSVFESTRLSFFESMITVIPSDWIAPSYLDLIFCIKGTVFTFFWAYLGFFDLNFMYSWFAGYYIANLLDFIEDLKYPLLTILFHITGIQWLTLSFFYFCILVIRYSFFRDKYILIHVYIMVYVYQIIYRLINSYLDTKYMCMFPFFFYLFITLLFFNIIGLFPFSFSITTNFAFCMSLSILIWVSTYVNGLLLNGFSFFRTFIIVGIPSYIVVLLGIIEILSYIVRVLSMSLRLFANLVAGHILIHVILLLLNSIVLNIFQGFTIFSSIETFVLLVVLTILVIIELAVACLQSYIYLVLSIMYTRDILYLNH